MGINRYDKAPEWNPGVLPYDMILKAADLTQQRWDKARAEGDQQISDIFKAVRTVPTSVDEKVVLPEIRSKYKALQDQMINDPDMNPTKYTMAVNNFVSENKPLLDRMTILADQYKALNTSLATKMMDPEFRADNSFLPWNQFDPSTIDSRSEYPWETSMNYKATRNWGSVIQDTVLDKWTGSTLNPQALMNSNGTFSQEFGKSISDLEEKATTGAANYMLTENFMDWNNDPDLLSIVPDDYLTSLGNKSYFNGLSLGELPLEQRAKAMIMLTGAEQLNMKANLARGLASSGSGGDNIAPGPEAPVVAYISSDQISPKDFATFNGLNLNADGSVTVSATEGFTKFASTPLTDEQSVKEANFKRVQEDNMERLGLSAPIRTMHEATEIIRDAKLKNEAFRLFENQNYNTTTKRGISALLDLPSGMTSAKTAEVYKAQTERYNAARTQLEEAVKNLDVTSPEWLAIQSAALELGVSINKPSDVIELNKKLHRDNIQRVSNMTEDDLIAEVRNRLGYKLVNSGEVNFRLATGQKNVISVDDRRFVKGYVTFDPTIAEDGNTYVTAEEAFMKYMERISPGLFNLDGWDGGGEYDSFKEFWEDIGSKIMTVNPSKKGGTSYSLQYYLPEEVNSPSNAQAYNREASGVGTTFDANKDAWNIQYPEILSRLNVDRLTENIAKTKGGSTAVYLGLKNALTSKKVPSTVSSVLMPMLNEYKNTNNYNGLARLNIIVREGLSLGWPADLVNAISGNPSLPQGQQDNPLGGIR